MGMLFVKRVIDLVGATVLLVLAAPVFAVVAVVIRVRMGRPVLFCQVRAGYHGKPFTLLKFRTMRVATGADGRPAPDADRLTSLGRMLRRTSLDELPQLINVLRGDMSLLGPRPLLMQYLPRYTPLQARRMNVKPGMAGWSQVNGRNALCWEEKLAMDAWYADNWSMWLDARIAVRSFWKIISLDGISHPGNATMPEFMGSPRKQNSHHLDRTTEKRV